MIHRSNPLCRHRLRGGEGKVEKKKEKKKKSTWHSEVSSQKDHPFHWLDSCRMSCGSSCLIVVKSRCEAKSSFHFSTIALLFSNLFTTKKKQNTVPNLMKQLIIKKSVPIRMGSWTLSNARAGTCITSARGHASHKAGETVTINKVGIITRNTTKLQGCVARNAPEPTRGTALLRAAAAAALPRLLKCSSKDEAVRLSQSSYLVQTY